MEPWRQIDTDLLDKFVDGSAVVTDKPKKNRYCV